MAFVCQFQWPHLLVQTLWFFAKLRWCSSPLESRLRSCQRVADQKMWSRRGASELLLPRTHSWRSPQMFLEREPREMLWSWCTGKKRRRARWKRRSSLLSFFSWSPRLLKGNRSFLLTNLVKGKDYPHRAFVTPPSWINTVEDWSLVFSKLVTMLSAVWPSTSGKAKKYQHGAGGQLHNLRHEHLLGGH